MRFVFAVKTELQTVSNQTQDKNNGNNQCKPYRSGNNKSSGTSNSSSNTIMLSLNAGRYILYIVI